jgi:hypothetical protein
VLYIRVFKLWCGHVFLVFSGVYLRVELLGHTIMCNFASFIVLMYIFCKGNYFLKLEQSIHSEMDPYFVPNFIINPCALREKCRLLGKCGNCGVSKSCPGLIER